MGSIFWEIKRAVKIKLARILCFLSSIMICKWEIKLSRAAG